MLDAPAMLRMEHANQFQPDRRSFLADTLRVKGTDHASESSPVSFFRCCALPHMRSCTPTGAQKIFESDFGDSVAMATPTLNSTNGWWPIGEVAAQLW